jgi:NDP-sugar pyrophosphorylase family protein
MYFEVHPAINLLFTIHMEASELFDLPDSLPFEVAFSGSASPWQWLASISVALEDLSGNKDDLKCPIGLEMEGPVFIHPSVKLPAYGSIKGPVYIAEDCELRPGVFIRGNVIAATGSVLGNSCEFKNCLLLENAKVPHFSYVGDSILGNNTHLGAGVVCSNLRLDQAEVKIKDFSGKVHDTGLRKLGAFLGDFSEVGCNAVLNPGTVLGRRSIVLPTVSNGGTVAHGQVAKR